MTLALTKWDATGLVDLRPAPVERHAIVLTDLTLFLNTETLVQIDAGNDQEGRALLSGRDRAWIIRLPYRCAPS